MRRPCRSPVAVANICSANTSAEDAGRSVLPSAGHDDEAFHLASGIGLEKLVILAERDAAVGLSVRPEHVGVGEEAGAAMDGGAAAYRVEAQGAHAVKELFALAEVVGAGRRGAVHPDMHEARVVTPSTVVQRWLHREGP